MDPYKPTDIAVSAVFTAAYWSKAGALRGEGRSHLWQSGVMENTILHIVGGDSRARAEQARVIFGIGHHAEVYADLDEFLARPPREGIVMMDDSGMFDFPAAVLETFSRRGVWLPLVVTSATPSTERAVSAIKRGALDYFPLPLDSGTFADRLEELAEEAQAQARARRRLIEARNHMSRLSRRESEVLELLSAGSSNKEIARHLAISPRTVEIHRANMMSKLGAHHAADAIRTWLDARGARPALPLPTGTTEEGATIGYGAQRDAEQERVR